ncbi:MAG TPA: alcohol dehydrogenase [Phycisphaerae bacterium]|nr:alcohol dehydrogenase [Phycisphaerae bacterium]
MAKMRVMQVSKAKGALEMVEREIPEPGFGQVRVKVEACGVCHSDSLTKEGLWPGVKFPRVPGHEAAGVIDKVGDGVQGWSVGEAVGVGWYGGHCGYCDQCRRGDFVVCERGLVTGISFDGGYQEYMVVSAAALARRPGELTAAECGPLMCAGVTTFNSLRNSGVRAGDRVAVLGIGGLGHLGVQYSRKMGLETVAIARGKDKEALAKKLGAHFYIDSETQNVAEELMKLGGAKVVLATATNAKAMEATIKGLGAGGKLVVLGADFAPMAVSGLDLIGLRRSVAGWPSGTAMDSQETMRFSALNGVRSMNEEYPLEKANEAYERMMSGKARFRVVLKVA